MALQRRHHRVLLVLEHTDLDWMSGVPGLYSAVLCAGEGSPPRAPSTTTTCLRHRALAPECRDHPPAKPLPNWVPRSEGASQMTAHYAVGVDIGGTKIYAGVINL